MPNGTLETGAVEKQGLPYHDDGHQTGYLAYQHASQAPVDAREDGDADVDAALNPCRPCIVIVATGCIERVNSTTRKHDERIDQQQDEDGGAEQVFLS